MDLGLTDRVVIVTGGGAGIGAAISRALAAEGAIPMIFVRRMPEAGFLADLRQLQPQATVILADLAQDDDCRDDGAPAVRPGRSHQRPMAFRRRRLCPS